MARTSDIDKIAAELERLRNDLSRVAKATENLVRNTRDDALEMGEEAWDSARETVERRIGEHPLQSAAIAVGVGVLIGMFFLHRR